MALNVDKVFRFVQFVSNKQSRGWISPEEFNIAAELSQIAVYSKLENAFLANKKIHSDMRPFLSNASNAIAAGVLAYPADFRQLLGARLLSDDTEIVELTQSEINIALKSTITAPTTSYPNCVLRNGDIRIYPASLTGSVYLEYISDLNAFGPPNWAYTVVSGRPVYDSGSSDDFGFAENLFLDISTLILANIGMNLKQEDVTQFGMAFNQAQ